MNCRFGVEQGRAILEACAFTANFCRPEQLPDPERQAVDDTHRRWRIEIIQEAKSHGFLFTHSVAAKLVNIYLKSRFVCGGHHKHPRVQSLHPPIDSVLLRTLVEANLGGYAKEWKQRAHLGAENHGVKAPDFPFPQRNCCVPDAPREQADFRVRCRIRSR